MCRYASTDNPRGALIDVKKLYSYIHDRGNINGLSLKENTITQTNKLLDVLKDRLVDLISVKEVNEDGSPKLIILKKRGEILISEVYAKAVKLLRNATRGVIDDKSDFYSSETLAAQLNISESYLVDNLIFEVDNDGLTEEKLYSYRNSEKVLKINIDENIHILIQAEDIKNLVPILIEKIRNFYEDPVNDNLRNLIFRGFKEKNIDVKKIPDILRGENISDKYFLFFTQLFINIMKTYQDQHRDKVQVHKHSLVNQYIAAKFLSILSMTKRKEDRKQKLATEKRTVDQQQLIKQMIEESQIGTRSQREYFPFTISHLQSFRTQKKEGEEKAVVTSMGELYDQETLRSMVNEANTHSQGEIPNIISFNVKDETYYLHRFRLIRAFFTARDIEADRIINRVRNEWLKYPDRIITSREDEKLYGLIDNRYVSEYFTTFLQIAKRVLAIDVPQDQFIKALQDRLFPTAEEIASMGLNADTLTCGMDGEPLKKNKILKSFIETIYFEGTFDERPVYQILGIDHSDIYDYVDERLGMNIIKSLIIGLKNFFRFIFGLKKKVHDDEVEVFSDDEKGGFAGKLLEGAKGIGKKIASAGEQVVEDIKSGTSEEKPKVSRKIKAQARAAVDKGKPKSKHQTKKEEIERLKKIAPDAKDVKELRSKMDLELRRWNTKIGDIGKNLKEDVDNMILKITKRFTIDAFAQGNAERLAGDIISNNPVLMKINNQNALMRYIYMRALLSRLEVTKE